MSYVGKFEYDIFISYARAKRAADIESPLKTWSTAFAHELKTFLLGPKRFSETDERTLKIFFDETEVDPMGRLSDQIYPAAKSSAILTVLMSADYLRSKVCADELKAWDEGQSVVELPNNHGIAIVRLEPTSEADWADRLKDGQDFGLFGYRFHPLPKNEKDVVVPYGYPRPSMKTNGRFRRALDELGHALWDRLELVREQVEAQQKAEEQAKARRSPKPTVYLHGRVDQQRIWNEFYGKLRGEGFAVLPSSPDPIHADPLQEHHHYEKRIDVMSRCNAVLVMGTEDDAAFDADLSYATLRAPRSLESRGHAPRPCALLDRIGVKNGNTNRRYVAEDFGVEWIDSSQDPWTPRVREWLQSVGTKPGDAP